MGKIEASPSEPTAAQVAFVEHAYTCDPNIVPWVFERGQQDLLSRLKSGELIAASAATTLGLMLAGIAGSLAFAVKLFEPAHGPAQWGALAVCAYFLGLAAALVEKTLSIRAVPTAYNAPSNMLIPGVDLHQLMAQECWTVEQAILAIAAANKTRGVWLNRVRRWAIATPVVFIAAAGLAARVS